MRLVFAGTPEAAVPSLRALLASRHDVVAVLTRPDARMGRGQRITPSPVADVARALGIETLQPTSLRESAFLDRLRALAPDCCPIVAYGALVPRVVLDVPPHGWVNLHFSLLPAWRGATPVQHAILAGDDVTGASTFRLDEGLDTGPVYGVVTEQIRPRDTAGDLLTRLADAGAALLVATVDGIADGSLAPVPQPRDGVSLAPKLTAGDARVDWSAPALRIDRLVRACTPAPGAWTVFRGERVRLGPLQPVVERLDEPVAARDPLAPGELRADKRRVVVGTGSSPVCLGEVVAQGKRAMAAADWARGMRVTAGETFE